MAKNKGGRPPTYKTVEEMQMKIDEYFSHCESKRKPATTAGLSHYLGFNSRQSLINYQGKKQFVDTITRAKLKLEEYAEMRLYDRDGARGAEFSLRCNFKWDDKQAEIENEKSLISEAEKIIVSIRKTAKEYIDETD